MNVYGSLAGPDATPKGGASAGTAPGDGALATAPGVVAKGDTISASEYAKRFLPRIPSEPWSSPAYDESLSVPAEAPRLFCMSSLGGANALGDHVEPTCTCLTEQGTSYVLDHPTCRVIARRGQYEPYRDERDDRYVDGPTQIERGREAIAKRDQENMAIARGTRAQGTFPESPAYSSSSVTPSPGIDL